MLQSMLSIHQLAMQITGLDYLSKIEPPQGAPACHYANAERLAEYLGWPLVGCKRLPSICSMCKLGCCESSAERQGLTWAISDAFSNAPGSPLAGFASLLRSGSSSSSSQQDQGQNMHQLGFETF